MEPSEFYAAQARTGAATGLLARRQWRKMGSLDDWALIVSRLTLLVTAGQVGAASRAEAYVSSSVDVDAAGSVNPKMFGGVASDGRPLDSLLYSSVVHARTLYGTAAKDAEIMAAGEAWLGMLVQTQIADAGRGATQVAIAARPRVGYVRFVSPPCCQRCAVLAGKFFKWNEGFQRHPRCDCIHRATAEGSVTDGRTDSITPDQIEDLTIAQRKAIGDGSDLNRVINSHRAGTRSGMFTTEGMGRRGFARDGLAEGQRRMTPEAIYKTAGEDREAAVALLRTHGYLI